MFSYDKMLAFEGNTAAFLLYAYVRIRSIQRKASVNMSTLLKSAPAVILEHPEELTLGLMTCQFSEVLEHITTDYCPHHLTDYLYRLAEKFHSFFHQCKVVGSEEEQSRLLLCEAVAQVLQKGLELLGLKSLERM